MTPRSIRRAAERKALKLARKQDRQSPVALPQPALAERTVLLPGAAAAVYCAHVNQLMAEYQPVGLRESNLVVAIADTEWRLRRIPVLELALYARGRDEFDEKFSSQSDPNRRAVLTDLETMLVYEKQLRTLHLQESRLRRAREKDLAELQTLQAEREAREAAEETKLGSNFQLPLSCPSPAQPLSPEPGAATSGAESFTPMTGKRNWVPSPASSSTDFSLSPRSKRFAD